MKLVGGKFKISDRSNSVNLKTLVYLNKIYSNILTSA